MGMRREKYTQVSQQTHCDVVAIALRELHNTAIPAHHSLRLCEVVQGDFGAHFDVSRVCDQSFGDERVLGNVPSAGAEVDAIGVDGCPKFFCAQVIVHLETEAGISRRIALN
jgi:hypothetical protein